MNPLLAAILVLVGLAVLLCLGVCRLAGRRPPSPLETGKRGCLVYGHRPMICRLFAASPDTPMLRCPHGCRPAPGAELTPDQAAAIMREYMEMPGQMPSLNSQQEQVFMVFGEHVVAEAQRLGMPEGNLDSREAARRIKGAGRLGI